MTLKTKFGLFLLVLVLILLSELLPTRTPTPTVGPASCLVTSDKEYVICVQRQNQQEAIRGN